MNIPLSDRLLACCAFVAPGSRVADVGCDHGYLSIWLLTHGIARSAIASDINEKPLQSAVSNAEKYGVGDRLEFYLSDGVRSIPRDFDTLICAGVGGDTIISILNAAAWLKDSKYTLVLQCQSKTPMLRRYLSENGWHICKETVLRDGRFLYTVMKVSFCPGHGLSVGQCYFPPALLEDPGPETTEYYRRTVQSLQLAVSSRGENADPEHIAALQELTENPMLAFLKEESL